MAKAALPKRSENYSEWYNEIVKRADLAGNSAVRGCMVIKPWGYGIWERIQTVMDAAIKDAGVQNCYFPLFIPLSFFEKEADHVDGFAKEMAVVTHHRLIADGIAVIVGQDHHGKHRTGRGDGGHGKGEDGAIEMVALGLLDFGLGL